MEKMKLLIFVLCILSTACSPKFYVPNSQNVPMLQEKGQAIGTLSGNGDQVELQGAYAATNNLGVQVNTGFFIPQDEDKGSGSGSFFELGAGYYTQLGDKFTFETYGLLGKGKLENRFWVTNLDPNSFGKLNASLLRYGVQPSISFHTKHFGVGLSSRLLKLSYSNIEGDLIYRGDNQIDYLNENKSNFLAEPALTLRGGWEKIKMQLQIVGSFNSTNPDFKQDEGTVTMGVSYTLN